MAPIEALPQGGGHNTTDNAGWWRVKVGLEVAASNTRGSAKKHIVHAAVDTGTSLIIVPQDSSSVVSAMFGDHLSNDCVFENLLYGALQCKCDIVSNIRPLSLEIGG